MAGSAKRWPYRRRSSVMGMGPAPLHQPRIELEGVTLLDPRHLRQPRMRRVDQQVVLCRLHAGRHPQCELRARVLPAVTEGLADGLAVAPAAGQAQVLRCRHHQPLGHLGRDADAEWARGQSREDLGEGEEDPSETASRRRPIRRAMQLRTGPKQTDSVRRCTRRPRGRCSPAPRARRSTPITQPAGARPSP